MSGHLSILIKHYHPYDENVRVGRRCARSVASLVYCSCHLKIKSLILYDHIVPSTYTLYTYKHGQWHQEGTVQRIYNNSILWHLLMPSKCLFCFVLLCFVLLCFVLFCFSNKKWHSLFADFKFQRTILFKPAGFLFSSYLVAHVRSSLLHFISA